MEARETNLIKELATVQNSLKVLFNKLKRKARFKGLNTTNIKTTPKNVKRVEALRAKEKRLIEMIMEFHTKDEDGKTTKTN